MARGEAAHRLVLERSRMEKVPVVFNYLKVMLPSVNVLNLGRSNVFI